MPIERRGKPSAAGMAKRGFLRATEGQAGTAHAKRHSQLSRHFSDELMNPLLEHKLLATRRHLLGGMGGGIGAMALGELLGGSARGATTAGSGPGNPMPADPLAARLPPLPAKAKRMIVIHLTGSPPNLDLYDHKPELVKHDGEDCPAEFLAGK